MVASEPGVYENYESELVRPSISTSWRHPNDGTETMEASTSVPWPPLKPWRHPSNLCPRDRGRLAPNPKRQAPAVHAGFSLFS